MTTRLLIDLDSKEDEEIERFLWALEWLCEFHRFKRAEVFETRKGFHVYIDVDEDLQPVEIMLLQQLLGSDPNRELYNYTKWKWGFRTWQMLFKYKYAPQKDGSIVTSRENKTERAIYIEYLANATIEYARRIFEESEEECDGRGEV